MNYELDIAKRIYSQGSEVKRASRSAITIATAGVAVGIAIMIISISVVLGFKKEVESKVTGIGSHIQVINYQSLYASESYPIAFTDTLIRQLSILPEVKHVQRFCQKTGMLKTNDSFQGVLFRGIDEAYDLSFLRDNLVEGSIDQPFSCKDNTGQLVVSQSLASQLRLEVGNRVYAYFFDHSLRARRFTISAIYATNMSEFDSQLVFCDYKTIHQLLGYEDDQASGAEILVHDMSRLPIASNEVNACVGHRQDHYGNYYTAPTIKESLPRIFDWLDLFDLNVIVILALTMAVAAFTTVSGLLIIILERTQFIGVMKALGATNTSLRRIFIYYAIFIIGRGLLYGNLLGLGLCFLQQQTGWVQLDASTYYVNSVPILISWPWVLSINIIMFLISTLALILPSFLVSRIRPAQSIRFE